MICSLGIDVGSSSVKISLLDIESGECLSSSTNPSVEMEIKAMQSGWAEQNPDMWWKYVVLGTKNVISESKIDPKAIKSIGITYQMHGLVCLDKAGKPLRDSIIWCDSRAVEIGNKAFENIGGDKCLEHLLNSPGNFTASKLAWVKSNEPDVFSRVDKFMLPGDYIMYKLTGNITTTPTGLSEQILWDFKSDKKADFLSDYYGIKHDMFPEILPSLGIQGRVNSEISSLLGIEEGTPIAYRAGDQPNNAFSLNVTEPGEIAATGGTSGVVYGVVDTAKADPKSRVNTFLHVNHSAAKPRYGVLLCINGTGIMNAWIKRAIAPDISYEEINESVKNIPSGSDGLVVLPFGNGAERMLENKNIAASFSGLDLNRHNKSHMLRATQEGIAFSFRYGIDIMRNTGLNPEVIRAGKANMFLSSIFTETLATICDAKIELYNTDGALGAARGAALGAGYYKSSKEAFATLKKVGEILPNKVIKTQLDKAYESWKQALNEKLK